jgi:hypothetical protein
MYSSSPFSRIEFHEHLLIISVFQYRISWKCVSFLHFPESNSWNFVPYIRFPVSNFMKMCSFSPFSRIEIHEILFLISVFQYRISWKCIPLLHFPESNFMNICLLYPFSSIEFHENVFLFSIFQNRISWRSVHYLLTSLKDVIDQTNMPHKLRAFSQPLPGMALKVAGWDVRVVYTKYTVFMKAF